MAIDGEEVEKLILMHGGRIYGFCRRLASNRIAADDLYQQTFLRVLDMPHRIDLENNPVGFLMAVATRIWQDERRKFARRQRIAPVRYDNEEINRVSDSRLTDREIEKKQRQLDVRIAIQNLPEKLRVPVLLYYMGNLPIKEIAEALRLPEGTVKARLHQARQKLRLELEGIGYDGKTVFE